MMVSEGTTGRGRGVTNDEVDVGQDVRGGRSSTAIHSNATYSNLYGSVLQYVPLLSE
jgi:hypothetical protein